MLYIVMYIVMCFFMLVVLELFLYGVNYKLFSVAAK